MFLEFYGLKAQPFGVTPDPQFICPSKTHSKAFISLSRGLEAASGFEAAGQGNERFAVCFARADELWVRCHAEWLRFESVKFQEHTNRYFPLTIVLDTITFSGALTDCTG